MSRFVRARSLYRILLFLSCEVFQLTGRVPGTILPSESSRRRRQVRDGSQRVNVPDAFSTSRNPREIEHEKSLDKPGRRAVLRSAQAAGIDSLKSLDLGNFEITRIREVKTPSDLGLKKAGAGKVVKPVVCVEVSAKKGSDSRVKMNIALPLGENWNKIYLAKGNGGLGNKTSADQAYYDATSAATRHRTTTLEPMTGRTAPI